MSIIDMTNPHTRMLVQLSQWRASLAIQINTGMGHSRGSVMALVRRTSTVVPNAFATSYEDRWSKLTAGPEGVLVYAEDVHATMGTDDLPVEGDVFYAPISGTGTFVRVFEDIDARIVELGGERWSRPIIRKGSTEKINEAAQRKHDRRIGAILALREAATK